MQLLILSLLFVFCLPADAHLCFEDSELNDVQQHSYELPYPPLHNYWNKPRLIYNKPINNPHRRPRHNLNLAFHVFGRFNGNSDNAVFKAGYYGEGNELIYSVEVNCADKSWKSYTPSAEDPTKGELYQEGVLERSCNEGEDFDLIFKVKQAHQFTWMFNAENLQKGYQETKWTKYTKDGPQIRERFRTLDVPSPDESPAGGAAKAVKFSVQTSGGAVMTRFAFGRCMAYPKDMPCNKAWTWLIERSKGVDYKGPLGLHRTFFQVVCVKNAPSLYEPTQIFHPDEFSQSGSTWVCCVDMKTGEIWENDKANSCRSLSDWVTDGLPFFCDDAFDVDLVNEESAKYEASQSD